MRLRVEWAGDSDQSSQCGDLLNSYRNRLGANNNLNGGIPSLHENWQCWSVGILPNGSTHWTADISLGTMVGRSPDEAVTDSERRETMQANILGSLKEHFVRDDIVVDFK